MRLRCALVVIVHCVAKRAEREHPEHTPNTKKRVKTAKLFGQRSSAFEVTPTVLLGEAKLLTGDGQADVTSTCVRIHQSSCDDVTSYVRTTYVRAPYSTVLYCHSTCCHSNRSQRVNTLRNHFITSFSPRKKPLAHHIPHEVYPLPLDRFVGSCRSHVPSSVSRICAGRTKIHARLLSSSIFLCVENLVFEWQQSQRYHRARRRVQDRGRHLSRKD